MKWLNTLINKRMNTVSTIHLDYTIKYKMAKLVFGTPKDVQK